MFFHKGDNDNSSKMCNFVAENISITCNIEIENISITCKRAFA